MMPSRERNVQPNPVTARKPPVFVLRIIEHRQEGRHQPRPARCPPPVSTPSPACAADRHMACCAPRSSAIAANDPMALSAWSTYLAQLRGLLPGGRRWPGLVQPPRQPVGELPVGVHGHLGEQAAEPLLQPTAVRLAQARRKRHLACQANHSAAIRAASLSCRAPACSGRWAPTGRWSPARGPAFGPTTPGRLRGRERSGRRSARPSPG